MGNATCSNGHHVPDDTQRQLRRLVETLGESAAILRLGISRQTLSRALAGLGVRSGTVLLIEQRLREHGDKP